MAPPASSGRVASVGPRMSASPVRLTLVKATWCPHCVPISTERGPKLAQRIGVPYRELDIDRPEEEAAADALVRGHGDWSEDYLVPQLFLEFDDGSVRHLLTGDPRSTAGTRTRWERLLTEPVDALRDPALPHRPHAR